MAPAGLNQVYLFARLSHQRPVAVLVAIELECDTLPTSIPLTTIRLNLQARLEAFIRQVRESLRRRVLLFKSLNFTTIHFPQNNIIFRLDTGGEILFLG